VTRGPSFHSHHRREEIRLIRIEWPSLQRIAAANAGWYRDFIPG
jgi:hypothetical protein